LRLLAVLAIVLAVIVALLPTIVTHTPLTRIIHEYLVVGCDHLVQGDWERS
jgi:hypothetical protein